MTTLQDLQRALQTAEQGSLTIGQDGSSFFVGRWGLHRFKSLPELSRFVAEVNGLGIPRPERGVHAASPSDHTEDARPTVAPSGATRTDSTRSTPSINPS